MSPDKIKKEVVTQRISYIYEMIKSIENLPLKNKEAFFQDPRNVAAAESYLRHALEALLDTGRHILVKGFAYPAVEYKDIANGLSEKKVLKQKESILLKKMAGYRNRMVHFYQEITSEELYEICSLHLDEIKLITNSIVEWLKSHNEMLNKDF